MTMTSKINRCLALLCSGTLFSLVLNAQVPSDGLVAYYPFDGDAMDASGNGFHGNVSGADLTTDRYGEQDSAFYFDGEDDSINLGNHEQFNFNSSDFSISAWIKTDSKKFEPSTVYYVIGKYFRWNGTGYGLGFYSESIRPYAFVGDDNLELNPNVAVAGTKTISDGKWHHLCLRVDRDRSISMVVDGANLFTANLTSENGSISTDYDLIIGAISSGNNFEGTIDDIAIYNRRLSLREVQKLYNEREIRIFQPPSLSSFSLTENIELKPEISEEVNPTNVVWFKNGEIISETDNLVLKIENAFYSDAGFYHINTQVGGVQLTSDPIWVGIERGDAVDSDKDGLPDLSEIRLGLDATSIDTDGDGLSDGWELGIGRYELKKFTGSWEQAQRRAITNGGHLGTITSQLESDFVSGYVGGFHNKESWFGLHDMHQEGKWEWVTGEAFTFSNWYNPTSEPNSAGGMNEDAGAIFGRTPEMSGYWNDQAASSSNDFYLSEIGYFTDPLSPDTDMDGLNDSEEIRLGLIPTSADSDSDGFNDFDEVKMGFNARDASNHPEPVVEEGLELFFEFNSNLNDGAMFQSNAVPSGEIKYTVDRFGRPNMALDASAGFLTIDHPSANGLDEWTFSIWFNSPHRKRAGARIGSLLRITDPQSLETPVGLVWLYDDNSLSFHSWNFNAADNERWFDYPRTEIDQYLERQWTHLAMVYSGGMLTYYLDNHKGKPTIFRKIEHPAQQATVLAHEIDLRVDDFRFYSRALSDTDIRKLFSDYPFYISKQPSGGNALVGGSALFSVEVIGDGDFTYAWKLDGRVLPNATSSTLIIPNITYSQSGDYSVEISQTGFSIESDPATVNVLGPPEITAQPSPGNFEIGQRIKLNVEAIGSDTFSYQWFFNAKPFLGATGQMLTIPNASEALSGEYYVIVTNEYGETTSETATVTISFIDTDGDGIGDWRELEIGTNPESPDTDGDGLSDWMETEETGTNPVLADSDADGLNDATELNGDTGYFTDPLVSDSDGDGLTDGEEVLRETYPTNPLVADTDADGLSDSEEIQLGINPTSEDTDGDGLGDADEVAYGYDPNEATEAPEGSLEIFRAVELRFFTLPGQTYQLHKSSDLENWEASGEPFVAEGGFYSTFARQEDEAVFWQLFRVED